MQIISTEIMHLTSQNQVGDKPDYVISAILRIHAMNDRSTLGEVFHYGFTFDQNTESTEFVSYQDLTKEIVLSWCQNQTENWNKMLEYIENHFVSLSQQGQELTTTIPPWIVKTNFREVETFEPSNETSSLSAADHTSSTNLILSDVFSNNTVSTTLSEEQLKLLIRQTVEEILVDRSLENQSSETI